MFKKVLLTASTAIVAVSSANAQNTLATAELRGNGASAIVNVLNQELNCFGGTNQPTAFGSTGTTGTISQFFYDLNKAPTTGNFPYNCDTVTKNTVFDGTPYAGRSVQPNVTGKYVSTGSGGGKNSWKAGNASGIAINPFGTWTAISFAFSDAPLIQSEVDTYNAGAAFTKGGAAIQIPLYVLPVAVVYGQNYGKLKTAGGDIDLTFNVAKPRADNSGGLKLAMSTVCGIFNGSITNWNATALTTDNGGVSLADADDTVWASAGAPIRLVGRSDKSGTTNIFTRALSDQCPGTDFAGLGGTDTLPAARLGTAVYNATTGALSTGTETSGKFGVASGSNGVAAVINLAPAAPAAIGDRTLNASIGYNGADWALPTSALTGSASRTADIVNPNDGKTYQPTAKNASTAFGGTLPPESDSKGKFVPGLSNGLGLTGLRSDPRAWAVPVNASGVGSLANPATGYSITGTTQMLTYTCFADAAVRNALQHFVTWHFGKITKDSTLAKVPANIVKGTGTPLGILAASGIAPLPSNWVKAIQSTFLKKVGSELDPAKEASLGLYIQDKTQTKDSVVTAANPSCSGHAGI